MEEESQEPDELSAGIENDEDVGKEEGVVVIGVKEVHEEEEEEEDKESEAWVWAGVADDGERSKQDPL